jgi:hypothetical protein
MKDASNSPNLTLKHNLKILTFCCHVASLGNLNLNVNNILLCDNLDEIEEYIIQL